MKIVVIHMGRKGAGPVYSLEMAKALNREGHQIYYYASNKVENIRFVRSENFNCRFFNTYDSKLSYLRSILIPTTIRSIAKCIKKDNPDVVYLTMNDLWAPFIFPKIKGITRIKTIHDVGIHEGNNSWFNKWWNKTNFRDAEKYVILSKAFLPVLLDKGILAQNISVIPHAGFDYYTKYSISEFHEFSFSLLFFGRIDKYKGIALLLDAMPIIVDKFPRVSLKIVGNGDISKYKEKINSLKNNVTVVNRWINDNEVAHYISKCDIIVLPYIHATQSGVIPLAYAFSKPVVATNVGGLGEQIIEGKTGLIINEIDKKAFANGIISLLSNPKKTQIMGQNAYRYMLENLTWSSSAKRLLNLIGLNKSID